MITMKRIEYHQVTPELLSILKIHVTPGSLRRDCSMASQMIEQPAEDECPRLFYALINGYWEVHAVELDLVRYLMLIDANKPKPSPQPFIRSRLRWDEIYGKSEDHRWETPVTELVGERGTHLIFDGDIAYYYLEECEVLPNESGNIVGFYIEFDPAMLMKYPNAIITNWNTYQSSNLLATLVDGRVHWGFLVSDPGEELRITIKWSEDIEESLIVMVTQNSELLSSTQK